jgi:hypothetical protein
MQYLGGRVTTESNEQFYHYDQPFQGRGVLNRGYVGSVRFLERTATLSKFKSIVLWISKYGKPFFVGMSKNGPYLAGNFDYEFSFVAARIAWNTLNHA